MRLTMSKETLAELTSDEMSAVIGGADSNSCTIANVCIRAVAPILTAAVDANC